MGQNTSKNRAKLHNEDKFKHLNKLTQNDAMGSDAERIKKHDTLHKRMLTPKLTRMMKSSTNAETATPVSSTSKLLERRRMFAE